ncbi:Essential protein Yae1, N terminal [Podospora pseudocomata]|uniref:Protein YAE1 n=1 Tax=Podospora pseudocomata TaxID=2093779 RepID=A0ABR0GTB1_9PEZI|nr:Essential protein Yae1, N terminal [Podospora pseudocomata]
MLLRHPSLHPDETRASTANNQDIFPSMSSHPAPSPYQDQDDTEPENGQFDDVWGDDEDNDFIPSSTTTVSSSSERERDINRLKTLHSKTGYIDGITHAKSTSVQAGFDEGFTLGANIGSRAGILLGIIEGFVAAFGLQSISTSPPQPWETAEWGRLEVLLNEARRELDVRSVFAKDWFCEDGTWNYPVGDEESGGEVLFPDVAASHPLIKKWDAIVRREGERFGLDWNVLRDEEGVERGHEYDQEEENSRQGNQPAVAKTGNQALAW